MSTKPSSSELIEFCYMDLIQKICRNKEIGNKNARFNTATEYGWQFGR